MRALKNYRRHKSSDFFLFMLIVDPTRITNLGLPGGNGNKKLMKNLLILSRMKMSHKRVTKMLCILSGFSLSCKNHVFFQIFLKKEVKTMMCFKCVKICISNWQF